MASHPKHVNHELGPMACPVGLDDVDLFGTGAQEHWYEAYEILHRDAPVLRIEGGGLRPGTDAFVLTKHADVTAVVKDPDRFPPLTTRRLGDLVAQGLAPEEAYASHHNLMQASMLSLRPTQELYFQHRRELTDPWVGPGALHHRDMITARERPDQSVDQHWWASGRGRVHQPVSTPASPARDGEHPRLAQRGHPEDRRVG